MTKRIILMTMMMITMTLKVENMVGVRDEAVVVREVASIMRSLTPLLTKISPSSPTSNICRSTADSTFDYLHSLAVILEELADNNQLALSSELNR